VTAAPLGRPAASALVLEAHCPNPRCAGPVESRTHALGTVSADPARAGLANNPYLWVGGLVGNAVWLACVWVLLDTWGSRLPPALNVAVLLATALGMLTYAIFLVRYQLLPHPPRQRLILRDHRCQACDYTWYQFDDSPAYVAAELQRLRGERSLWRLLRNRKQEGICVATMATLALNNGEAARAEGLSDEAIALFRELGRERSAIHAQTTLALSLVARDDARATSLLQETLARHREAQDWVGIATAATGLAFAELSRHETAPVASLLCEGLALSTALADRPSMAWSLEGLAWTSAGHGDAERAYTLLGAAAALRAASGVPEPPIARAAIRRLRETTRATLGNRADTLWAQGHTLAAGDLHAYACPPATIAT
jgi:hypothetical protein